MADRSYHDVTNDTRFSAMMAVHSMRGPAATYGVLLEFMNEEGWCWPSKRIIAQMTGRSDPRNILRDLHWLQDKGYIEVGDSTGGMHTAIQRYRIDLDHLFDLEARFRTLRAEVDVPAAPPAEEADGADARQKASKPKTRTTPQLTVANSRPKPVSSTEEAENSARLMRDSLKAMQPTVTVVPPPEADVEPPQAADLSDIESEDGDVGLENDDVLTEETVAEKIAKFGLGYNADGALEVIRSKWLPYIDLERIEREVPLLVTAYGGMQPPSDARNKVEAYMEHVIGPLRKQRQVNAEKQELRSVWERRVRDNEVDDEPFSRVWSQHIDITCNDDDPTPAASWWDWVKQAVRTLGEEPTHDLLNRARHAAVEERYALLRDEIRVREGVAQVAEHERRMGVDAAYAISYRYGERMELAGLDRRQDWLIWLEEAAQSVDAMTLANWHDEILRKVQSSNKQIDMVAYLNDQFLAYQRKQEESDSARLLGGRRSA